MYVLTDIYITNYNKTFESRDDTVSSSLHLVFGVKGRNYYEHSPLTHSHVTHLQSGQV